MRKRRTCAPFVHAEGRDENSTAQNTRKIHKRTLFGCEREHVRVLNACEDARPYIMILRRGSSHSTLPDLSPNTSSPTSSALPGLVIGPAIKKSISQPPKEQAYSSSSPQPKVYQIFLNRDTRDASPPPRTAPSRGSPLPSLYPITTGLNESKTAQSSGPMSPIMTVSGVNYKAMKIPQTASGDREHFDRLGTVLI